MIARLLRKKITEGLLFPLVRSINTDPNHITLLTYPLAIICAYFLYIKEYPLALLFLILSSVTDNLDGAVAKLHNRRTDFGNYFDAFSDKIQEFFVFMGFALSGYALESFFAISTSMLVTYAKARAEMVRSLNNMDWPSFGERAERLFIVALGLLISIFYESIFSYNTISVALYTLTLVNIIGIAQRFFFAMGYLKSKN